MGDKKGIVDIASMLPQSPSESIVETEGNEAEKSDEDQGEPKPELETFVNIVCDIMDTSTAVISTTMAYLCERVKIL